MVVDLSNTAMDQMLYGDNSNFMSSYLTKQMENLSGMAGGLYDTLKGALQTSYNYVTDKLVQYSVRDELSRVGLNVLDNQYMELLTWQALQEANITNQRFIMSHPEVRQLYLDQNIDGYSDQYVNHWGKGVGVDDYNYRLITDGVILDHPENEEDCIYRNFYEDLEPGDVRPDHHQKATVMATYDYVSWMLGNCNLDFTNVSEQPTKINRS